ncbi:MAPEG family protein [Plastorhodobacter daqingensis]|uniref:MAPEG family protein n=1 Tax=Plastorhodobacter daqingensis TaxID=1387281 RepID=A0ABW2UKL5_9RHOB
MTPELTALALAALLQALQFLALAIMANRELGPRYTTGPRDDAPPRPLSPVAGRLQRALSNHFEGLILFTVAVVVVSLSGQAGGFTAACAWIYLVARALYVPAYAFGWSPWRSVIWGVGFSATLSMIVVALI